MRELIYEGHFDAAHKLEPYLGKCRNLHGHTWQVYVRIEYDEQCLTEAGLSIDFHDIKGVIDTLDHAYINDVIGRSASAENILEYLLIEFRNLSPYFVLELRVWESENASVRFTL